MPLILPIKELRNTNDISNIAHKHHEPIFITKNGYSDLVVMSSELYDEFARINRIDKAIFESEQELLDGAEAVKINPKSISELDYIYNYIAIEKSASENARAQINRIKNAILGLDTFPESHQVRTEGRYAGKYRQLLIDNYIVIFRIDELHKTVYVVTVQYQGRNI